VSVGPTTEQLQQSQAPLTQGVEQANEKLNQLFSVTRTIQKQELSSTDGGLLQYTLHAIMENNNKDTRSSVSLTRMQSGDYLGAEKLLEDVAKYAASNAKDDDRRNEAAQDYANLTVVASANDPVGAAGFLSKALDLDSAGNVQTWVQYFQNVSGPGGEPDYIRDITRGATSTFSMGGWKEFANSFATASVQQIQPGDWANEGKNMVLNVGLCQSVYSTASCLVVTGMSKLAAGRQRICGRPFFVMMIRLPDGTVAGVAYKSDDGSAYQAQIKGFPAGLSGSLHSQSMALKGFPDGPTINFLPIQVQRAADCSFSINQ
jgi:hypothetical protein